MSFLLLVSAEIYEFPLQIIFVYTWWRNGLNRILFLF